REQTDAFGGHASPALDGYHRQRRTLCQSTRGARGRRRQGGPLGGKRKSSVIRTALTVSVALVMLAVAPVALAGKSPGGGKHGGGGTSGGSSSLSVVMVADANQNGLPNWGDTIRFNVS